MKLLAAITWLSGRISAIMTNTKEIVALKNDLQYNFKISVNNSKQFAAFSVSLIKDEANFLWNADLTLKCTTPVWIFAWHLWMVFAFLYKEHYRVFKKSASIEFTKSSYTNYLLYSHVWSELLRNHQQTHFGRMS